MKKLIQITSLFFVVSAISINASVATEATKFSDVKVDKGVLYWQSGSDKGKEVALFGVNYSSPFAYTYRAIKRLGIDHKKAIDMDVEHFSRLGLDAYRIHLWDRELSDDQGNLLDNHHLALFDYLLFKLKQKNIKVIITPIAWWGSGYPEPDPKVSGFSSQYKKEQMNQSKDAIALQKIYLAQLMQHKNPHTGISYGQEKNIIAFEIFNEPKHHKSPKESIAYVEELITSIRNEQVSKPLFYNISEQGNDQAYAKALCNSDIDGIAYQWYPTGLVKYSTVLANMLPMVASYNDVFADIDGCENKAKMIYEFDAADVAAPVMYPAMARSFRSAGFQWATLFSYDPGVLAHTNSEYNTHYVNLLYTPSKAISLMIAAETFRELPRGYQAAVYPESNEFEDVSLDYQQKLSLLNNAQKFYYSNNTTVSPKNVSTLQHIAGVGSSEIVSYNGSGSYFLDKLENGLWQLEVYPDLQKLEDPHQNSSLRREVGRLYPTSQQLTVNLADLGNKFYVSAISRTINSNDEQINRANAGTITVKPGKYLLSKKKGLKTALTQLIADKKVSRAYYLPPQQSQSLSLVHQPQRNISVDSDYNFTVQVGSAEKVDKVELMVRYRNYAHFTAITMTAKTGGIYNVQLPKTAAWSKTGPIEYAFTVSHDDKKTSFPGGVQGSPMDWDYVKGHDYWRMDIQPKGSPVALFDAAIDRNNMMYPKQGRVQQDFVSGENGVGTVLKLGLDTIKDKSANFLLRTTMTADNLLKNKLLTGYNRLVIKARSLNQNESEHISLGLLDQHGLAYSKTITLNKEWQTQVVALSSFTASETMLANAYPTFMPSLMPSPLSSPMSSKATENGQNKPYTDKLNFNKLNLIQGLQIIVDETKYSPKQRKGWHGLEIESIHLIK